MPRGCLQEAQTEPRKHNEGDCRIEAKAWGIQDSSVGLQPAQKRSHTQRQTCCSDCSHTFQLFAVLHS